MNRLAYTPLVCALLCGLLVATSAQAAARKGRTYETPQAAVEALIAATKADNPQELAKILGPGSKKLIDSEDAVADSADRAAFAAAYAEKNALVPDGDSEERYQLQTGQDSTPFPIPIVKVGERWAFDVKAGAETLIDRRIGHNELSAMQVCLAYAEAQRDYLRLNPTQAPTPHYAVRIASKPGQRDGLYWETKPGEPQSPLGALAAAAEVGGYEAAGQSVEAPFFGYRYRVLTSQGKHAQGGARNYIENNVMSGGFALLAYPASYGSSGVMSFMINQDGVIYEKNLGKKTASLAKKITSFDPDDSWHKTDNQ